MLLEKVYEARIVRSRWENDAQVLKLERPQSKNNATIHAIPYTPSSVMHTARPLPMARLKRRLKRQLKLRYAH